MRFHEELAEIRMVGLVDFVVTRLFHLKLILIPTDFELVALSGNYEAALAR